MGEKLVVLRSPIWPICALRSYNFSLVKAHFACYHVVKKHLSFRLNPCRVLGCMLAVFLGHCHKLTQPF